ncbi:fimbrial protein [Aquitalea pelogenes]|uniref:fimbrial protein n=1 Tax=Aquitalea pelogenes TaxID=1293573 RepID=UPI00137B31E6|nr:fimbrial protein [Aquitalea pelogenes]
MRVLKMNLVDRKRHSGITAKNVLPYLVFSLLVLFYSTAAQALNGPCQLTARPEVGPRSLNTLLNIKNNTPINSQIGNEVIISAPLFGCQLNTNSNTKLPADTGLSYVLASSPPTITINNKTVIPTLTPSIGVAIGIEPFACPSVGTVWISSSSMSQPTFVCNIGNTYPAASSIGNYHYIFYKLSNDTPSSGTLKLPRLDIMVYFINGNIYSNIDYSESTTVTTTYSFSTVPTCAVSTPSITVPLNNMLSSSFKGVGSVSATQNFQIGLSCSGGNSGTSSNTYITFTDNNQPGNTSTTLTLAGGTGAATGLGLQILNNGTPIGYGPDSNAPGNTNQWQVANISQGVSSYLIPLGVRYIQTGSAVTPGAVTGRATFTMSYQ